MATVGRLYGLTIELQAVLSKQLTCYINILNCRPAKFGMGNDYVLLYKGLCID